MDTDVRNINLEIGNDYQFPGAMANSYLFLIELTGCLVFPMKWTDWDHHTGFQHHDL